MNIRTVFLLIVLVIFSAFAALNWGAFMAPTPLSLGFAVVEAPLGMVMLGLVAILTSLFLVFVLYLQTTVLLDARRHARELQINRELADKAEASRFTELRGFLEAELKRLANLDAESRGAVLARIEQLDGELRTAIEESGNTLSAYIGELDDRLEQKTPGQSPRAPS